MPPAFQKRAWAGSLAFSIQSPPRDCLTEGSSRWRTASGVSFASKTRSDAAASCSTRSGLGPLPEEPRALVGCEAHAGALPLGEGPWLPWDFAKTQKPSHVHSFEHYSASGIGESSACQHVLFTCFLYNHAHSLHRQKG